MAIIVYHLPILFAHFTITAISNQILMQSMSRSSQTANYWDKWDSLWLFLAFKQIPVKLIVAIKCLQSLTCYLALAICYLLSVTCYMLLAFFLKLVITYTNLFPFARCCTSRNFLSGPESRYFEEILNPQKSVRGRISTFLMSVKGIP